MQFTTSSLLALAAAFSQALAKVILTNTEWTVVEGQPFTITWAEANGPVSLLLKNGPSDDLATLATIATGLTGTSFTWTPTGLASGTYAIEIDDTSDMNYGAQFTYTGTAAASTPTSPAAPSSPATTDAPTEAPTEAPTTGSPSSTGSAAKSSATKVAGTSTSTSATSTNTPLNTNGSEKMGSPLALILLTVAALQFFN